MRALCIAISTAACALLASTASAADPPPASLPPADQAAAFRAAGFSKRGGQWHSKCEDPGTPSYTPGAIETVKDLNGDGQLEAVITEGGTFCYGDAGQGYWLVGKQAGGAWKLIANGTGMASFLDTRGAGGWPDLEVGGPGFCFPVERWNGKEYKLQRYEYEGKPCKPGS